MNALDLIKGLITPDLIGKAAGFLGESSDSTSKGINAALPSLLGGILNSSSNENTLSKVWGLINHQDNQSGLLDNLGGLFGGASEAAKPDGIGGQLLNLVLGNKQSTLLSLLGSLAGFKNSGSAGKILSMVAPLILSYLGKKVKSDGLNMASFASWLGGSKNEINRAMPAGFAAAFSDSSSRSSGSYGSSSGDDTSGGGGSNWWMWLVGLLGLLGLMWMLTKGCNKEKAVEMPKVEVPAAPSIDTMAAKVEEVVDSATAAIKAKWAMLGDAVKSALPGGVELNIPANGIESKLLAFINDAKKPVDKTTWFNFDRILFETGSSNLNPMSKEQMDNMAAILKAFPKVNLKIGGYTDNVGDKAANMKLSGDRAIAVMNALVANGIDAKRLSAEGYGDQHPVGDNKTPEGREQNRRVAVRVTQK